VNYGGSTGFGREYRERLYGNWGIVDMNDCCNAALFLVKRKLADPNRLIITGGSAGGYTTLCALTFRDVFKAGASYYGISDLEASNDTHKFESRYNYRLIAPWPEGRQVYHDRSPLRHADKLNCPVIFFQGLDDKVVLPNQSQMMVEAMRKNGLFVEYHEFAGEGHGFRQAATIKKCLEAELAFYRKVFRIA
jgi:dipeptidyl aminopeptidase/acylaminoacyl peptidase